MYRSSQTYLDGVQIRCFKTDYNKYLGEDERLDDEDDDDEDEEEDEEEEDELSISSKCSSHVCGCADSSSLVLNSKNFDENDAKQSAMSGYSGGRERPSRIRVILAETKRPSRNPPYQRSERIACAQG